MWFRLAALWGCPIREAMARCDAREFVEWCAFYRIDPWGEQRADLRIAELSSMFYNVHKKENAPDRCPSDFMHFLHEPDEPSQPVEKQISIATQLAKAVKQRDSSI